MAICYIVGAGDFFGRIDPEQDDLVIAADGGYDALISHGVAVNLLIGDMDSLHKLPSDVEMLRFPPEKDYTDTFLAYTEGVKRGYTEFHLYGCTGGREDHTYANYALLSYALKNNHRAYLFGDGTLTFTARNSSFKLFGEEKEYFSLFALGGSAEVRIEGAKYDVDGAILSPDFPLGVSNEFRSGDVKVTVSSGEIIVMARTEKLPVFE